MRGGSERLADALCGRLQDQGIRSDVVTVPFQWEPKEVVIREALAWRLLDLDADLVIPLKFPAYFISHPRKLIWLCHQFRQLYEFHGTELSGFANTPPDHELRKKLVDMDKRCLREALSICAISENTLSRLRKYNGLDGEVLYPPPMLAERLGCESYGDYILAVGRLDEAKRFDLFLRAIAGSGRNVKAKIAGTGPVEDALKSLARDLKIADRVEFLGAVDDEELVKLYNNCRAVHFAPLDEDYGLVAVEAMTAAKPVITAVDSGGPLEHVRDGVNGFVLPPEPEAHAGALNSLWQDLDLCKRLGELGKEEAANITWDKVINSLLRWLE